MAEESKSPDGKTPVADRIRERLKAAQTRFHANDSIAGFIEPGELDALQGEVQARLQRVLDALVIDTGRRQQASWRRTPEPRSYAPSTRMSSPRA